MRDALDRATAALTALVESSNGNTKTMARLQKVLIALTVVYVVLTGLQLWMHK